jgi:hypothetical protein
MNVKSQTKSSARLKLFSLTEKDQDKHPHKDKVEAEHEPVSIKEETGDDSSPYIGSPIETPSPKKPASSRAVPVPSVNSSGVVPHVTYVLIGAGTASFAAMKVRICYKYSINIKLNFFEC